MRAAQGKPRRLWPFWAASLAFILFSSAGFARMMGWGPGAAGHSGALFALDAPAGEARARPRCPECGMIVATREIERHGERAPRSYEFVVRMADGSSRVIEDADPGRWRAGEFLIVIDGIDPPRP
jgi:hypothetical protein